MKIGNCNCIIRDCYSRYDLPPKIFHLFKLHILYFTDDKTLSVRSNDHEWARFKEGFYRIGRVYLKFNKNTISLEIIKRY